MKSPKTHTTTNTSFRKKCTAHKTIIPNIIAIFQLDTRIKYKLLEYTTNAHTHISFASIVKLVTFLMLQHVAWTARIPKNPRKFIIVWLKLCQALCYAVFVWEPYAYKQLPELGRPSKYAAAREVRIRQTLLAPKNYNVSMWMGARLVIMCLYCSVCFLWRKFSKIYHMLLSP